MKHHPFRTLNYLLSSFLPVSRTRDAKKKEATPNKKRRGTSHSEPRFSSVSGLWYWVPRACLGVGGCHLLLGRNYNSELFRAVRPIERSEQLDPQSLFRPQVGSFSAPLPLEGEKPQDAKTLENSPKMSSCYEIITQFMFLFQFFFFQFLTIT